MSTQSFALSVILAVATATPAVAKAKGHRPRHFVPAAQPAPEGQPDDLYRRRGYGQGGLVFGGRGGTAMAGACADVAFARPLPCEPGSGYGLYGNGLGYPFGF